MGVVEYEEHLDQYGEIISSKLDHVGYEIRFMNLSGNIDIFHRLYEDYLSDDYTLSGEHEEIEYYKAYFLRKNIE